MPRSSRQSLNSFLRNSSIMERNIRKVKKKAHKQEVEKRAYDQKQGNSRDINFSRLPDTGTRKREEFKGAQTRKQTYKSEIVHSPKVEYKKKYRHRHYGGRDSRDQVSFFFHLYFFFPPNLILRYHYKCRFFHALPLYQESPNEPKISRFNSSYTTISGLMRDASVSRINASLLFPCWVRCKMFLHSR